jgi:hypothetical protein
MPSVCIVGLPATVNNATVLSFAHQYFYERIYVARKNLNFFYIHVKCPIFLPDFKQIWNFCTGTCPEISCYFVATAC